MTHANSLPAQTPIGENSTPIWGMTNAERLRRLARAEGLPETAEQAGARLYVNLAYVFDPVWLRHIVTLPGTVVMDGGNLVMAHLTGGMTPADIPEHQGALTIIDRSEEPTSELQSLMRI